jgi:hypothetical protein
MEVIMMADMVLDTSALPKSLYSRIATTKVRVHQEKEVVILSPIIEEKPRIDQLIGTFSDGKISIDQFLQQKISDDALEND